MIEKAYQLAKKAHGGQCRKSGEPYIVHPLWVAIILADLEMDKETIAAGLLHDVVEDTVYTEEQLAEIFGKEVALLVDGVTKLTQLNWDKDKVEIQAENLRKMFLAMSRDIRVVIVKLADRLHKAREKAAAGFAKQILATLAQLGMPDTVFEVALTPLAELGRTGRDNVVFLFTANRSATPQPVERIASGGELSRFLLALMSVRPKAESATYIFDEVDAGVGGLTLNKLAEKLENLAKQRQMLVIPHWPQLAARAQKHFQISKTIRDNATFTTCVPLDARQRHAELVRMAGGGQQGEALAASLEGRSYQLTMF